MVSTYRKQDPQRPVVSYSHIVLPKVAVTKWLSRWVSTSVARATSGPRHRKTLEADVARRKARLFEKGLPSPQSLFQSGPALAHPTFEGQPRGSASRFPVSHELLGERTSRATCMSNGCCQGCLFSSFQEVLVGLTSRGFDSLPITLQVE